MTDTLPTVLINIDAYIDVHAESGISGGTSILIENKGPNIAPFIAFIALIGKKLIACGSDISDYQVLKGRANQTACLGVYYAV